METIYQGENHSLPIQSQKSIDFTADAPQNLHQRLG